MPLPLFFPSFFSFSSSFLSSVYTLPFFSKCLPCKSNNILIISWLAFSFLSNVACPAQAFSQQQSLPKSKSIIQKSFVCALCLNFLSTSLVVVSGLERQSEQRGKTLLAPRQSAHGCPPSSDLLSFPAFSDNTIASTCFCTICSSLRGFEVR